ncbi:MAG: indole-3-glycerol phosphate synthase TrpC [Gammaproteobacteria bacterium]|nr:indole-3-glycerol phosphate synthase TrpC [Gammaproteobacteria bacterium]MXY55328.1 indole-3-glycerol phosphate synthase TrpC [Gammaproteobacteria bacterium]MYF31090.1 indole-3-glycerol phosphate synthase TrpC [Gammaproteobacteria bacterium]MYK45367.1 indole-3-glycerol phosphate synthase TrpC [Gammaproteobacteria bacterium]
MNRAKRDPPQPGGILAEIVEHKRAEVVARRRLRPLAEVRRTAEAAPIPRGFAKAIKTRNPAVIAEIKRASPSEGVIRADFDPAKVATSYERAGAACLSVLTDTRYFMGCDGHLEDARNATKLPALRKDFIVDPYQVYESRALGADCLLLIAAALEAGQLGDLARLAGELGLDVLIEVHDRDELDAALDLRPKIVGINNRDLATFTTNLDTTIDLLGVIPDAVAVVAESGIHSPEDVRRLQDAGVRAFLVGTAFMRAPDPGRALERLFG